MPSFTPHGNGVGAYTASISALSPSTSSQLALGPSPDRNAASFYNGGTQPVFLAHAGSVTVALYTTQIPAGALYEMSRPVYCGPVSAVWAAGALGTGSLLITENV